MQKTLWQDLIMNGTGNVAGGEYDHVKIRGEGRITGDLDCNEFRVWGTANVSGSVKARFTEVAGTAVVSGLLDSNRVNVYSTCDNFANVACKELHIKGTMDVKGHLQGEEIKVYGSLFAKEGCEAESFIAKGVFNIRGLLQADHIKVDLLHTDSRAKEIVGNKISVKRYGMWLNLQNFFRKARLLSDQIEGEDIYLEYTKAKVVRGNNVTIGPGCEIDLVEYRNEFTQTTGTKVQEHVKI